MKIYFGSHMQVLALGLTLGALLGWALTRAYFVAMLRRIQRRVAAVKDDLVEGQTICRFVNAEQFNKLETELRRRKL